MSTLPVPETEYLLYIDEAGDEGIRQISSIDGKGGTEWFVMAGVLVRHSRRHELNQWISEIKTILNQPQLKNIHFRELSAWKQQKVIEIISGKEIRIFIYISHKENMRGYSNEAAQKMKSQNWFFNFGLRVLCEKATKWCRSKSRATKLKSCGVKIILEKRGNVRHSQTVAYFHKIRDQSTVGNLFLKKDTLAWECYHDDLLVSKTADEEPGLQLADAVASYYYARLVQMSLNVRSGRRGDHQLGPIPFEFVRRIGMDPQGRRLDFGLKIMPDKWERTLHRDISNHFRSVDIRAPTDHAE